MKKLYSLLTLVLITCSFSFGQWIQLSETFGGNSVGTVKAFGNRLFAGTFSFSTNSKVYKSDDFGLNWNISNTGIGTASVHTFANIGSIIYAATYAEGVFKSVDSGVTWTNVLDSIPNVNYYSLSTQDSVIIVGTDYGELYQSLNLGSNWTKVDSASVCNYINTLASNATNIFAASCNGILTSIDSGISWTVVDSGLISNDIGVFGIKDSSVFATDNFRVYRTTNNGILWTNVTNNLNVNPFKRSFGTSGYNLLVGTQDGVFITTDDGQSWLSANVGLGNNDVNAFTTLSNFIFAATNIGVFRIDSSQITTVGSGVNELGNHTSIKLFPNPFNNELNISVKGNEQTEIILYDILSRKLLQRNLANTTTINTEQLASGLYIYELRNKNRIIANGKVIKH